MTTPQPTEPLPRTYRFSRTCPETASDLEKQSPLVLLATWQRYQELDAIFHGTGTRVRFLHPLLEIMSPISRDHETLKKHHACLVEAWCADQDIDLIGVGSATMKIENEAGGEPDESYFIGEPKDRPDLVIEVALTSGGLSKREFYAQFKVPELWIWRDGKLKVHVFEDGTYIESAKSKVLPRLDLGLVAECAALPKMNQAIRTFRARSASK